MGTQCLTVSDKRKIPTRLNCPMHGVLEKLIHSRVLDCWIIMSLGNRSIRSSNSISITKLRVDHSIVIIFFTLSDFTSDVTMQCYNDLASIWWIWRSLSVISFMTFADMIKIQSMTFLMDKIIGVSVLWNLETLKW